MDPCTILSNIPIIDNYVITPIKPYFSRAFNYKNKLQNLKEEVQQLKNKRDTVQSLVTRAENNGRLIHQQVKDWLKETEHLLAEDGQRLAEDEVRAEEKCFIGLCPNFKTRCQISKKAETQAGALAKLREDASTYNALDTISSNPPPEAYKPMIVRGYDAFESRKALVKDIKEAFAVDSAKTIGVYGLAGVGKTTLVREVARQVMDEKLFDATVMVHVTATPNLEKIQEEIAESLGLNFGVKSVNLRASELRERLKKEKKILVILDDLWEKLDLDAVGIPLPSDQQPEKLDLDALGFPLASDRRLDPLLSDQWLDPLLSDQQLDPLLSDQQLDPLPSERIPLPSEHAGCNILMTSRSEKVLSQEMGVEKILELKVLQDDEAWALFGKMAGGIVKEPDFQDTAKKLSQRCAGLPVLLVAVATALKKEKLHAWKDALRHLASFDNTDDHLNKQISAALDLTYNHLKGKDSQALFLLGGQLGPFSTPILDLLKYGLGLGLFESYSTLDDARNRLYKLVDDLKASCLLLQGDQDGQVKMHDVVRRFAISVAAKKDHVFTTTDDAESQGWPARGELEQCTAISLPYSRIPEELPAVLECPKLRSFLLASNDPSLSIDTNYFKEATELKVLVMKQMNLSPLPSSLQLVANMQTLCLHNCYLEDITIIGGLKQLEVLSLVGSSFVQLPSEIRNLTRLKLLDLSDCRRLEVIPPNVLSCLTLLEDLYMKNSFRDWETEGPKSEGKNANVRELKRLSKLVNLDLHIKDVGVLSKDIFSGNLKRFRIFVGEWQRMEWEWDKMQEATRSMKLQFNTSGILGEGFQVLLERTQHLELEQLKGFKSILYGLGRQGLMELMHLHVCGSTDIEFVVDSTSMGQRTNAFPRLEVLSLEYLENLEKICNGRSLLHGSFSKLRVLKVNNCHKLKHLISSSLVRDLQELEEISALSCNGMEVIIAEERDGGANQDEEINLIRLRKLEIVSLPQFKSFRSKLKVTALPNLDELTLKDLNVESLWLWHAQLPAISFLVQNLTSLKVIGCHNLKHLLCPSMVRSFKQLKNLEVEDCELMEVIIFTGESHEEDEGDRIFELQFVELVSLLLKNLPKLKRFCAASFIEFPLLKRLLLENCDELQTFISNHTDSEAHGGAESKGFLHANSVQPLFDEKVVFLALEEMEISRVTNLRMLWNDRFAAGSFCTLKALKISKCNQLVKIFTSSGIGKFRRLEQLSIHECESLEVIFDLQELNVIEEAHAQLDSPLKIELLRLPTLRHIWSTMDPQQTITFRNVHSIKVDCCPLLQHVFPSSIARDLPQLKKLWINDCNGMEEVVGMLGEATLDVAPAGVVFIFPKLTKLSLRRLRNLRSFYAGVHTLDCPKLKTLELMGCERAKLFTAATQSRIVDQKIQQPLFLVEQVMPALQELSLDCRSTTAATLWQFQFPADQYLPPLKILTLNFIEDEELNFLPLGFLGRLPNLETLNVQYSSLEALFSYRLVDAEKHPVALTRLSSVSITSVDNLRHLWEHDHPLDRVAPNLETLQVQDCGSLINLGPSSATFHTLTTLDVYRCNGLLNLMTTSTAKSLERLVKLTVRNCRVITEIIGAEQHGEETKHDEIHFSKLKCLELIDLHNLISFCSETYNFKFPRLKRVTVQGCPNLSIFCPGVVSTPKLRRVQVDEYIEYQLRWEDDLNSTIKRMYEEMVGFNDIRDLKLSEFPNLKEIWHGELPKKYFGKLESLTVDECACFSYAMPSALQHNLLDLKEFVVRNCNSLETIFDLEKLDADGAHSQLLRRLERLSLIDLPSLKRVCNKDPLGILELRTLSVLRVHNCGSLRYVLTPSMALSLKRLEKLEIRNCMMMETVIGKESTEEGTTDTFTFPQLKIIVIESLPNLTGIYSGNGFLELPFLKEVCIDKCPKMKAFVSSILREHEPNTVEGGKEQREDNLIKGEHDFRTTSIFSNKVVSQNLGTLRVEWIDVVEDILHGQVRAELCRELKVLELRGFPPDYGVCPYESLQKFRNLESLVLTDAFFEEIVQYEETDEEGKGAALFAQLKTMKLSKLPKLIHLAKEDTQPNRISQNLQKLEVMECGILETLVPSAVSFERLETLKVSKCDRLTNLIRSSTAKSLVNLTKMSIIECKMMQEVVVNKETEVVFSKLKILRLHSLPSLTSFCSGNCAVQFPCLEELLMSECPEMKTFSQGDVSTPLLLKLQREKGQTRMLREGDLNATIQELHRKRTALLKAHAVTVSELPSSSCGQPTSDFEAAREGKKDLSTAEDPMASKHLSLEVESPTKFVTEGQDVKSASKGPEITQLASAHQDSDITSERKGDHGIVHDGSGVEFHHVPLVEKIKSPTHVESVVPSKLEAKGPSEDALKQQTLEAQKTTVISVPRDAESDRVPSFRKRKASTRAESTVHSQQDKEERQDSFVIEVTDVFPLSSPSDAVAEEAFQPSSSSGAGLPPNFPTAEETPSRSSIYLASTKLLEEISSITDAGEPSLDIEISGPPLTPTSEFLHNQRKALRDYFNMPLEDIQKANAFDDIERISSAINRESSILDEKGILQDLLSRLAEFREKVPKAMLMKDIAEAYRSSQARKSTDLQENLALSKDQLGMLAGKMSQVLEEKAELEIEIQRLIGRKEALLDLENSIASEMQNTYKSASRNVADWRDFKEEAKHVEDNWYKGEEMLIQANASWTLFKRRLALGL